jgi:hypothetical protein
MSKLEQPFITQLPVPTGTGAVQAHPQRTQFIDTKQPLVEVTLEAIPSLVLAQRPQHILKPVVAKVQRDYCLVGALRQGIQPPFCPGLDLVEAMVSRRQDMAQPDHCYPSQAQTLPVAMGWKVIVQQGLHTHMFQLSQQKRNIIHTFTGYGKCIAHTESLTEFLNLVYF